MMSISILLALIVFLLLVSKILPPTSLKVPLVARFILFTFITNVFTIASTVFVIHCSLRTPHTSHMPAVVRRLFLYWLPRLLLVRRPLYHLRAGRKLYSRARPLETTGYPVHSPEMTSSIGRRVGAIAAWSEGRLVLRRRFGENDGGGDDNRELHHALEAVNFVAVHLKNDDEFAEVGRHFGVTVLLKETDKVF